ncbi:MAG: hypothetical protein ACYCWW_12655 [Deltaproteobacteria bacterium]
MEDVRLEIERLRDDLRERRSVDHFAHAWGGTLSFLILLGCWVKLFHDSLRPPLFLWPGALLVVGIALFVAQEVSRGLTLLATERGWLRRLRDLEASLGPGQELF